jgi:hypothetical protein
MTTSTTNTAVGTSKGTRLAPALDRKLADTKQPLLDVAAWYTKSRSIVLSLDEMLNLHARDYSANELAALNLSFEDFQSEAEIATRPCRCTRPDPNVCECYATLKAARAALVHIPSQEPISEPAQESIPEEVVKIVDVVEDALCAEVRKVMHARGDKASPQRIGLWPAMLFLAQRGNELAQAALALALRVRPDHDDAPPSEILFLDRRFVALLYAALDAHPDHDAGNHSEKILCWHDAGIEVTESARLVDWFCTTHPMQVLRIERDALDRACARKDAGSVKLLTQMKGGAEVTQLCELRVRL